MYTKWLITLVCLGVLLPGCSTKPRHLNYFGNIAGETKEKSEYLAQCQEIAGFTEIPGDGTASLQLCRNLLNEKIIRENYCQELFLEEGYDVVDSSKGKELESKPDIYQKAYESCKKYQVGEDPFPTIGLGLALSGGGTRSASFSTGVLKALYEIKSPKGTRALKQVDAISSVSGGGYATYWYFMQDYYRLGRSYKELDSCDCPPSFSEGTGYELQDIFRTSTESGLLEEYRHQKHLAETSDIIYILTKCRRTVSGKFLANRNSSSVIDPSSSGD